MHSKPSLPSYAPRVCSGSWFSSLDETFRSALLSLGRARHLSPGQRLFGRGDAPDGLYCVLDGAIRISNNSDAGKEALLTIIEPPHWFGEIALVDGRLRTHDAVAEGAAELHHVSQNLMLEFLTQHPQYWRDIAALLTQKIRATFLVVEEAALLPASGRLARRLITIAGGYGEWTDRSRRVIAVPQEQLALMLALSRQTVNQVLKQFEAQGAVGLSRGGIEILDMEKLRTLSS